jgi:hypothetical protein
LRGPETGHAWLIDEALESPLQFPKNREVIFEQRETSFASEKSPFKFGELGAANRVGFAFPDLREEGAY